MEEITPEELLKLIAESEQEVQNEVGGEDELQAD